jgi:DNA polymerase-1
LTPAQLHYAAADAAILLPLAEALRQALVAARLTPVAAIETRALPALVWLRRSGLPLSVPTWLDRVHATTARRDQLAGELAAIAGREVAWRAPAQVQRLLRERGHELSSTNEAALLAIAPAEPLVPLLLAYREAAKLAATYGADFVAQFVHPVTGRIHADFHQLGAASGRMACSRPNLQQLPRDPGLRRAFQAPPGRAFVKADFSQIELRIMAALSGDLAMLQAYRTGGDLHVRTGARVLGVPEHDVTTQQRQLAKALNFGLIYGMGAERFRAYAQATYGVHLTAQQATAFRERFFREYRGLRAWQARQGNNLGSAPDLQDLLGRAPAAPETRTVAGRRRLAVDAYPMRLNTPVQGTGADILKLALAHLCEDRTAFPTASLVLVVHDEIVVECDEADAPAVADWLQRQMEAAGAALVPAVPIVAEPVVMADLSGTPLAGHYDEREAAVRR